MGCPDWPKCFGLWIPPLEVSEVPLAYWNDPLSSANGKLVFNVVKTWTEYLNRLLGVVIGFSILIQSIFAFVVKSNARAKLFSIVSLVLVIFQGWLGSKVVSTDLKPLLITIHLSVALLIAISLLISLHFSFDSKIASEKKPSLKLPSVVILAFIFLLIQFFIGTEVRAQVDVLFKKYYYASRSLYVDALNWKFLVHRSFSIFVLCLLFWQIFKAGSVLAIRYFKYIVLPLLLSIVLVLSGITLAYFEFPEFAQPFHLLFGFGIVCAQIWLILKFSGKESESHVSG